ncbi:MAG: secD [Clostridia bacterium]|nr:secD [Clostridia bacterium]
MKGKNIITAIVIVIVILVFAYLSVFGLTINDKVYIPSAKNIKTGLDISGGISITYQAVNEDSVITAEDLKTSEAVIRARLEKINIYDFFVRTDDSTKQIYVEIPANVKDKSVDPLEAVKGLDKTAKIEFKDPDGNVLLAGSDIKGAKYSEQPTNSSGSTLATDPHVVLEFSEEGTKKFAAATEKLVGKTLAISLDGNVITEPTVNTKIDSNTAIITMGSGTYSEKKAEAQEYAMLIDSGVLPFTLKVINKEYVGPYIGQQALEISVKAGIVSFVLVALFMIFAYRLPGLVSVIALICYTAIMLYIMVVTNISITLAGIAGTILSVGMAVDANVIIFERLKEELKLNIGYKKAFEKSFKNAMSAIVDGNITTIVIGLLLYIFGIGPIKGFGIVLAIGVLVSMFTAIVVTKVILKQVLPLYDKCPFLFGIKKEAK